MQDASVKSGVPSKSRHCSVQPRDSIDQPRTTYLCGIRRSRSDLVEARREALTYLRTYV